VSVDLVVIGLGYVGLPLAAEATRSGLRVLGYDVNSTVVASLNAGTSHVDDIADSDVDRMRSDGFTATTDEDVLDGADAVVVCVPTPLAPSGGPDLSAVNAALATVTRHLHRGQLVVLESTTFPGTTDEIARPLLEATGLHVGTDVHLAFSPERIDPGNAKFGVQNTPKVVGGCTPECTRAAVSFYERFIDTVIAAKGTREAEMSKLLENTYRHVNIALVNELARFCHELQIDIWDVIRLASSKPFGFEPFYPGPGVGGHCIPVDPHYLAYKVRTDLGQPSHFIELAQSINSGMPDYVVARCAELLTRNDKSLQGAKVLLLGVTYKRDIGDTRETPAVDVALAFQDAGANVSYHDPHVPHWHVPGIGNLISVTELEDELKTKDIVVLLQNHREYDDAPLALAALLFDTRGQLAEAIGVERL
jgi:UDP-N-acetyl-D-glucosamine dehydrogenase